MMVTSPDSSRESASTAGEADGDGGPLGDGTLLDAAGEVVLNDSGHGYRLKNFFGWELRGADGVYGPDYQGHGLCRFLQPAGGWRAA